MQLSELESPCLVIDQNRLDSNIHAMNAHLKALNVRFRPHVKTHKSLEIARLQQSPDFEGLTVSTLREAEYFAEGGFRDLLYGVSLSPNRFQRAAALLERGVELSLCVDDRGVAVMLNDYLESRELQASVFIEVDVDGHRAGVDHYDNERLQLLAEELVHARALRFEGLMTHAGESYACFGAEAIQAHAELERSRIVSAAERLRHAGVDVRSVSVGSTPTARHAQGLEGVTDARPGVYAFYDLVMAGIGACRVDEIALSVLTTVIGHKRSTNTVIVDAGALALSKDRGTAKQARDCGFGLVCDIHGNPMGELIVNRANQEHGLIEISEERYFDELPIGSILRVLPNHACMTAAAHDSYFVCDRDGQVVDRWERCNGW